MLDIKIIAAIAVLISIIIIGAFMLFDSKGYFDIRKIFRKYVDIFNKNKCKVVFIYIVLLTLSIGIGIIGIVNEDLIETITLIISILCGAFLAFIPIVMGLQAKGVTSLKRDLYTKACSETNSVLMFELLISIIELFFCFVYMFIYPKIRIDIRVYSIALSFFSSIIYYLVFVILLNVLFILKRIRILISFQDRHTFQ